MIQINNLSFSFAAAEIFNDLNFNVNRGEILSIIGPNGCGKSTLLRLLRGSLKAQAGEILWDKIPVGKIPAGELARKVAVVPQSSTISFPYKVRELVAMGRYPHRKNLLSFQDTTDLQAIEPSPAFAHHADIAAAPALLCDPRQDLERVILFLRQIFIGHMTVRFAGAARVYPDGCIPVFSKIAVHRLISHACAVPLAIRNILQNSRDWRIARTFGQPDTSPQTTAVRQGDPDMFYYFSCHHFYLYDCGNFRRTLGSVGGNVDDGIGVVCDACSLFF